MDNGRVYVAAKKTHYPRGTTSLVFVALALVFFGLGGHGQLESMLFAKDSQTTKVSKPGTSPWLLLQGSKSA